MILPVTLTLAAAAGLLNVWLAVRTSLVRLSRRVDIGDGGDPRMLARMRAHANYAEYTPFVLILVAVIELARGANPWLWGAAALYVLARIAHPIGMERPALNPFRAGGITVTLLVLLALSGWALGIVVTAGRAGPAAAAPIELTVPQG